jgi:hypothetical protein
MRAKERLFRIPPPPRPPLSTREIQSITVKSCLPCFSLGFFLGLLSGSFIVLALINSLL